MTAAEQTKRFQSVVAAMIWSVAVFALDLVAPHGVAVPMLYVGAVLVTLWPSLRHDTLIAASAGTLLTIVGFFLSSQDGIVWMGVLNRALAVLAIWVTVLLILMHKEPRRGLRGLLPICASCKKIRDSRDEWRKFEEYIEEHSEAIFSHGMCLDCCREWYPEQYRRIVFHRPELLWRERRNGG
ncbi:MAG: hypothetical protein EPO61_15325 [Nitrospirae bacterium]|nr:MAG: hypothetical protein EPO61_15325 [Nitrospirota bacterium]